MKTNEFIEKIDKLVPDARCELNYHKDYELLIATVLSAQCTDKRVNEATEKLFKDYNIFSLAKAKENDIQNIIYTLGSYSKKSKYIIEIAKRLVSDCNGSVPNNREYLESLPGVGRKTCNVVLSNLFDVPAIAVDTHVARVSIRLGIADEKDTVLGIEKKLMKFLPKEKWSRTHHQLVLFGRYICKSKNPKCEKCLFTCKYRK